MATLGDLVINITGNSRDARNRLAEVRGMVESVTTAIAGFATAGLGAFAVKLAADAEQVEVAFTTMLGSAEKARKTLADLNRFAAETPFEQTEINQAARSLLAFQTPLEELLPTLRAVGDVAAGTQQPFAELATLFGKARLSGRLMAEDINQLTERGIPIISELAKQFGVAESQVKKLVESGQVNFGHLQTAFRDLTSEGGMFAGMMEAQSRTLGGLWSTLKDAGTAALRNVGTEIIKNLSLKDAIGDLTRYIALVESIAVWLAKWSKAIGYTVGAIVLLRGAMLTITVAQKAIAAGQAVLLALAGPKGWTVIAGGAIIAAAAITGIKETFQQVSAEATASIEKTEQTAKAAGQVGQAAPQIDRAAEAMKKYAEAAKDAQQLRSTFASDQSKLATTLRKIRDSVLAEGGITADLGAAFERRAIDQATGVYSKIRDIRDEIALLQGTATETGLALRDMLAKGAPAEEVERLRQLFELRKQLQTDKDIRDQMTRHRRDALRQRADEGRQIAAANRTPLEKFQDEIANLRGLLRSSDLDPESFRRAVLRSGKEFLTARDADQQDLPPVTGPQALELGTAEAFSAIQRALSGSSDPASQTAKHAAELVKLNRQVVLELKGVNANSKQKPKVAPKIG